VSYQPGVVRVRTYADVKAEFLAHGETKSATADGTPAGASARGLPFRRHITPSAIHLVGKEVNALDFVERGLIGDLSEVVSSYHVTGMRPSSELLHNATAGEIARAFGVSVRTVREWRRKDRKGDSSPVNTSW
jgi:hypothetical protein